MDVNFEIKQSLEVCRDARLDVKNNEKHYTEKLAKSVEAFNQVKNSFPRFTPNNTTNLPTVLICFRFVRLLNETTFNEINKAYASKDPYQIANLAESVGLLRSLAELNLSSPLLNLLRPLLFSHGYIIRRAFERFDSEVDLELRYSNERVKKAIKMKFLDEILLVPGQALEIAERFVRLRMTYRDDSLYLAKVQAFKPRPVSAYHDHKAEYLDLLFMRQNIVDQLEGFLKKTGTLESLAKTIIVQESKLCYILSEAKLHKSVIIKENPWYIVNKSITAMYKTDNPDRVVKIAKDVEEILNIKLETNAMEILSKPRA